MTSGDSNTDVLDVNYTIDSVVHAMDDASILVRLEFAKNLVFDNGGDPNAMTSTDPALVVADKILESVIEVLRGHPAAAQLKSPEPS
jgi:hypothetical protein